MPLQLILLHLKVLDCFSCWNTIIKYIVINVLAYSFYSGSETLSKFQINFKIELSKLLPGSHTTVVEIWMFIATNFLTNLINRLESSHPTSQYYIKRNVQNKGAHQLWSCGVDCVNNCIWPIFDVTYYESGLHKNVLMKIIPKWTVLIETYLSPYFWPQSLTTVPYHSPLPHSTFTLKCVSSHLTVHFHWRIFKRTVHFHSK